MAINNPVITDSAWLQDTAVAIQEKGGGGKIEVPNFAARIRNIPSGAPVVLNPALILWDWEGTKLAEYSKEDVLALIELPSPNALVPYAGVNHDFLMFREWNWSLEDIKELVQRHKNVVVDVGAIYMTTDGDTHNDWNIPRLESEVKYISTQKRKQENIPHGAYTDYKLLTHISVSPNSDITYDTFVNCTFLAHINIPKGIGLGSNNFKKCNSLRTVSIPKDCMVLNSFNNCSALERIYLSNSETKILGGAFENCTQLKNIILPESITAIEYVAFSGCTSLLRINIPGNVTTIGNSAFAGCSKLFDILNESKATIVNANVFSGLPSEYLNYVPRENISWFETETNWSSIYADGHIVAIEDYIDYLESIGFNVDKYK